MALSPPSPHPLKYESILARNVAYRWNRNRSGRRMLEKEESRARQVQKLFDASGNLHWSSESFIVVINTEFVFFIWYIGFILIKFKTMDYFVAIFKSKGVFIYFKIFFFYSERHTERGRDIGRERSRHSVGNLMEDLIPEPQDHHLSQRQMLKHWATQASQEEWFWMKVHWRKSKVQGCGDFSLTKIWLFSLAELLLD